MSQDKAVGTVPDLSDLDQIQIILTGLQRRLGKAPASGNAIVHNAAREALLVITRAKHMRDARQGVPTQRK